MFSIWTVCHEYLPGIILYFVGYNVYNHNLCLFEKFYDARFDMCNIYFNLLFLEIK